MEARRVSRPLQLQAELLSIGQRGITPLPSLRKVLPSFIAHRPTIDSNIVPKDAKIALDGLDHGPVPFPMTAFHWPCRQKPKTA